MTDSELRELCQRFFDAYENRRTDVLAEVYAPECVIWNNVFGSEMSGADNITSAPAGYAMQRRRTYNDRQINTFDCGFVIQYSLHGVQHNGHSGALWVCIVAQCRDGRITRINEYLDSGKFGRWRGKAKADEAGAQPR